MAENQAAQVVTGRLLNGYEWVHKFGANDDVDSSAIEDIWAAGGLYNWPTSAVTVEAISTSANDTAAGTGAREIMIEGLDNDFNTVMATLSMNGTSATTATTQTFRRLQRGWVSACGTYESGSSAGGNAGDITVRTSGGGDTHLFIDVESGLGVGQTQVARYTIPAGRLAYLTQLDWSVDRNKFADCFLYQRQNADVVSAPFGAPRLIKKLNGVNGTVTLRYDEMPVGPFQPKTDIYARAIGDTNNTAIDCEFNLILLPYG